MGFCEHGLLLWITYCCTDIRAAWLLVDYSTAGNENRTDTGGDSWRVRRTPPRAGRALAVNEGEG